MAKAGNNVRKTQDSDTKTTAAPSEFIHYKKKLKLPKYKKPTQDVKAKVIDKSTSKLKCKPGDAIVIAYTTYYYGGDKHGQVIDSNDRLPFTIGHFDVFEPWERVIKQLHCGDQVRIIVSSALTHLYHTDIDNTHTHTHSHSHSKEEDDEGSKKKSKSKQRQQGQDILSQVEIISVNGTVRSLKPFEKGVTIEFREKQKGKEKEKKKKQRKYAVTGDKVCIHYIGTFHNGEQHGHEFDNSYKRGQPLWFVVGKGKVIRGWDLAIPKLSLHSKAKLYISYDFAYGERGTPDKTIPHKQDLVFEVEVLEISSKGK